MHWAFSMPTNGMTFSIKKSVITCMEMLKMVTLYIPIDLRSSISWMGSQERANMAVTRVTRLTTLLLFLMLSALAVPPTAV